MSDNVFYKALAAVSTVGIVFIAGIQLTTALKKGNTAEDQLAKTIVEIKNARKDALDEVRSIRAGVLNERKNALAEVKSVGSEVVKELNGLKSNTLSELKTDRAQALEEINGLKSNTLSELKIDRAQALEEINKVRSQVLESLGSTSGNKNDGVWLVLALSFIGPNPYTGSGTALEKIPLENMEQCELEGAKWVASSRVTTSVKAVVFGKGRNSFYRGFECIQTK